MKKVLALVLSLMMILGSVSALAAGVDTIVNGDQNYKTGIEVREPKVRYNDDAINDISGQAATELWLQVEASGQIDVTVPLVLVFQTNIDGGSATSPNTYKITNHSSADLVVTKIAVKDVTAAADTPSMTKVAWSDTALKEDQYMAKLNVAAATMGKAYANQRDFDLNTAEYTGNRHEGGIFELAKAPANQNETGTDTAIALSMKTGKLSFVTSRKDTTTNDQLNDEMDTEKGIQLLTITYTVAIDTSDAYGETITTAATATNEGKVLSGTTDATRVQPRTTSGAAKDEADKAGN